MSYWLRRWSFSHSRSRPVTVTLPEATQDRSTGNWLSQSVPLLSPPATVSPSLPKSRGTNLALFGFVDFVIVLTVLILPYLPRWVRDRDSTESPALYLFVLSAGPPRALSLLNGLSRLCHITWFFTSTIRFRPRLSRALLLSLFSMPNKLSGCRSFRFFFTDSNIKKKKN